MVTSLKISAKGQVTLKKPVLAHLGLAPGQCVDVDLTAGGLVQLRPAHSRGKISDVFGMLKRTGQQPVSIEEMSKAIERGWAGDR